MTSCSRKSAYAAELEVDSWPDHQRHAFWEMVAARIGDGTGGVAAENVAISQTFELFETMFGSVPYEYLETAVNE